ncbi:MAG: Hpt domain-containing protein [Devosiaceae bacterium]|nr:Hpt domain-containing protein [Devosiaceae bacterium]
MSALEKILDQESAQGIPLTTRPIDLVHLSRQSLGDPGLESEILLMFDQMVQTYMSRIRKSIDREKIAFSLHALKGAAAGVGATNVALLARAAEKEMHSDGTLGHETLADLRVGVEEVRYFIAELMGD